MADIIYFCAFPIISTSEYGSSLCWLVWLVLAPVLPLGSSPLGSLWQWVEQLSSPSWRSVVLDLITVVIPQLYVS